MPDRMRAVKQLVEVLNILNGVGIIGILIVAFVFQYSLNEPPCPLCLLQRVGFILIGTGYLFNLKFGFRPSHYALIIAAALFTSTVAMRQIALHVIPGTGAYGTSIFGLHMYTWSFIASVLIICSTVVLFSFESQFNNNFSESLLFRYKKISCSMIIILFILAGLNCISVINECGLGSCPENPTSNLRR